MRTYGRYLVAAICVSLSVKVNAQDSGLRGTTVEREDHWIVFELGAASEWTRDEGVHNGGTLAFEVTPVEHWLELEAGATAITSENVIETAFDVLFKKPWQPSSKFEFMIGVGPEIVHAANRDGGTFWGAEAVLDFMFWPKKNLGWYVEPGYEAVWRGGKRQQGIGWAIGVLIGR